MAKSAPKRLSQAPKHASSKKRANVLPQNLERLEKRDYELCASCKMYYKDHIDKKCLFDAGTFKLFFWKCSGYEYGCRMHITIGAFCKRCAAEYAEDPDAFK